MTTRRVDAFHAGLPMGTACVQTYCSEPTP